MATFLIALFSVVLVLVCLFVTLLVLMQKPSANSGMGAALGGGAAEQAFGGEATNVLTRGTIYAIIAFFVLSFALYLGTISASQPRDAVSEGASIGKLSEAAAAAEGTSEGEPSADDLPAVAGDEEEVEVVEEVVPVEEVEAVVEDQAEDAASEVEEKAPLQLESLDAIPATPGS